MDLLTLFSANLLLLLIFAISFQAMSLRVTPSLHWRSWATANALLAGALVCFAFERVLPSIVAYLLPNTLLLLGFGFHLYAARVLARLPNKMSDVFAPAFAYMLVGLLAYVLSNATLAYVGGNVIFTILCVATIFAYTSKNFHGQISVIGLVLAFFFLAAVGGLRIYHGLAGDAPAGPGMINDMMQDLHLMSAMLFVSLTGAFSTALSFEQVALRHKEAARRDPLTGAYNRRELQARLDDLLHPPSKKTFGLVNFDLDHFKQVNDRFGHLAGDAALVKVVAAAKGQLRKDDCFARLGGEEFAVLLPDISRENAAKVADRLRECIADLRFDFAPPDFRVTASAGIYHGDGNELEMEDLLQVVDESLYRSKRNGRNCVTFAAPLTSET
ncbi:GGDEF domain-containing protein [Roseibium sp. MMSF_3544]|uniref:GGDEF domain-containing protein n=1 Tax=unclassified Roseibium TaxID=2629323 RepID=UPI00273DC93A|nr:GGDEF domain-containing protein [Roseibium sp. MMSF_3544]